MNIRKTIAIDYSWLGPTGIGRVADEVIARRPLDWDINGIRVNRPNAGPFTAVDLTLRLQRLKADLFWSPGFIPPMLSGGKRVVLTVHDLTHLHYYGRSRKLYYDWYIRPLLQRVDRIITVSEFTRNELMKWAGLDEEQVTMIHNGVSPAFSQTGPRTTINRPFILYVGNRRSYKNVPMLMRAFASSGLIKLGFTLALTGGRSPEYDQIEAELGIVSHVRYLGFVPEEELPTLYRSAHAVAFISLYEGFGLPIVEAMASGTPVLTSNVSSMPEVAGSAAILVDPRDMHDIAGGLRTIALDEIARKDLVERGLVRARQFDWDVTGKKYWQVFNEVVRDVT
jgi:glycosyltransferase involved in cell wall biosynthesis